MQTDTSTRQQHVESWHKIKEDLCGEKPFSLYLQQLRKGKFWKGNLNVTSKTHQSIINTAIITVEEKDKLKKNPPHPPPPPVLISRRWHNFLCTSRNELLSLTHDRSGARLAQHLEETLLKSRSRRIPAKQRLLCLCYLISKNEGGGEKKKHAIQAARGSKGGQDTEEGNNRCRRRSWVFVFSLSFFFLFLQELPLRCAEKRRAAAAEAARLWLTYLGNCALH